MIMPQVIDYSDDRSPHPQTAIAHNPNFKRSLPTSPNSDRTQPPQF